MKIDAETLWDECAYALDDRRTCVANTADIAAAIGGKVSRNIVITQAEWDDITDNLHREHSAINASDMLEYLQWASEEKI